MMRNNADEITRLIRVSAGNLKVCYPTPMQLLHHIV